MYRYTLHMRQLASTVHKVTAGPNFIMEQNMESLDNASSWEKSFNCLDQNLSREDVTEEYWSLSVLGEQHTSSAFGMSVVLTLMFVIGVTWNLIVIATIIKKHLYTIPSVLLLLNLVVTDLLFCLLVMPFSIVTGFAGEYIFGKSDYMCCQVCKFNIVNDRVNIFTSSLNHRQTCIPQKATSLQLTNHHKENYHWSSRYLVSEHCPFNSSIIRFWRNKVCD